MERRNQPSEGMEKKRPTLPAALAFFGVVGYGPVAGQVNTRLETDARNQAVQKVSQTRDHLHKALGHFSLRNNPGINRADCETVQTLTLDGKACELGADKNGLYFITVEGEGQPYFLGEEEKAMRVISTLKNIFGPRQDTTTILAANNR